MAELKDTGQLTFLEDDFLRSLAFINTIRSCTLVLQTPCRVWDSWWMLKLRAKSLGDWEVKCLQSVLYQTVQSAVDTRLARIQNGGEQAIWRDRSRLCRTLQIPGRQERRRKVLCYFFNPCQLQSSPFRNLKSPNSRRIKKSLIISRRTRPRIIISVNAKVLKSTADWVKTIRKTGKLQNYLARENIHWQFNLAKSPWWGGI